MKSSNQKLSSLRFVDPTRWRAEILAALKLENGNVPLTAERLKLHRTTLHRWLADDAELRIAKRKMMAALAAEKKAK